METLQPSVLSAVQKGHIVSLWGAQTLPPGFRFPPWDAAKQPDSAGDWHPLLKTPGEKHAAVMPPHQPLQHREDWKSSGSRTELTNLPCITASVLSLSLSLSAYPPPLAVTQQAPHVGGNEPVFSCYRGSSYDCDARGQAWASHSPLP